MGEGWFPGDAGVNFVVGFHNWRKLTNRRQQIRIPNLIDGIAVAEDHRMDCLLATELGTSACTGKVDLCNYEADWEMGRGDVPGFGVGGFFHRDWNRTWLQVCGSTSLVNTRFWIFSAGWLVAWETANATMSPLSLTIRLRVRDHGSRVSTHCALHGVRGSHKTQRSGGGWLRRYGSMGWRGMLKRCGESASHTSCSCTISQVLGAGKAGGL